MASQAVGAVRGNEDVYELVKDVFFRREINDLISTIPSRINSGILFAPSRAERFDRATDKRSIGLHLDVLLQFLYSQQSCFFYGERDIVFDLFRCCLGAGE